MRLREVSSVRHCGEHIEYVIAKSQVNHLPVCKSHGDVAICSLLRQGIGIQLPNHEIATARIILQIKELFMRLAMTIEAVEYVIAKSLVNHLPVRKSGGDEAIRSLLRQNTRIQLPNDEIAQPKADRYGANSLFN